MSARMLSLLSVLSAILFVHGWSVVESRASQAGQTIAWGDDVNRAIEAAAKSGQPVLVHFYSDNCVPCKMLDARAFKHPGLCRDLQTKVLPVKINVDHHRDLAIKYQITKWPTDLYLHPNGQEIYRTVSPQDPDAYVKLIDRMSTRNRDWITERIAQSNSPMARNTSKPQLAAPEPSQPVTSQSPRFQPVSQTRLSDEAGVTPMTPANATIPTESNPYCADPVLGVSNVFDEAPQGPFHLASHARENRYQARTSSSVLTNPQPTSVQESVMQPGPTPAQPPSASNSGMAGVTIGGVFNDSASVDLDGYCPVSLMARSEWVLGNPSCAVKHRGRVYYCINEEAQQFFLATPDRFAPVLSGYDIVHFLETGELVAGKREHGCRFGVTSDRERVFLFATPATRQRFNQEAVRYALSLGQTDDSEATQEPRVAGAGNSSMAR